MRSFPLRQQWWIQDFPEEKRQRQTQRNANLLFGKIVAENSMNMNEFNLRGSVPSTTFGSATA